MNYSFDNIYHVKTLVDSIFPISQSITLSPRMLHAILLEAGRDVALINSIPVDGFGWIQRDQPDSTHLRAELPTFRAFALEYWDADIAYLAQHILSSSEIHAIEQMCSHYSSWLDETQAYLAHGDFDTTHIFQHNGHYTGIIDFGEIRGATRWYDVAQFHMRDGEYLPCTLLSSLLDSYKEVAPLTHGYMNIIRFTALLISVRTLVRTLQKRPPNRFTTHQIEMLQQDIVILS